MLYGDELRLGTLHPRTKTLRLHTLVRVAEHSATACVNSRTGMTRPSRRLEPHVSIFVLSQHRRTPSQARTISYDRHGVYL